MRYFASFLAAAAIVQAATPVARQASPSAAVRSALEAIISDAGAIQSAVQGLTASSSAGDIATVEGAITKLQNDIDSSAQQFASTGTVSNDDALKLADLVGPLESSASNAVDAVVNQKQVIVGLCVGPVAYSSFQKLLSSAQTLGTNLQALFSPPYDQVVAGAAQNVETSLNRGLSAFSDSQTAPAQCSSGGGGGGTTTNPPTGTTTAPPGSSGTGTTTTPSGSSGTGKCYRRRHRPRHD